MLRGAKTSLASGVPRLELEWKDKHMLRLKKLTRHHIAEPLEPSSCLEETTARSPSSVADTLMKSHRGASGFQGRRGRPTA